MTRAATRYVSPSGLNTPPYTNWESAAVSIQSAVNAAGNGDVVLVTNGVYHENVVVTGKTITLASMYLYSGDESDIITTEIRGTGTTSVVRFGAGVTTGALFSGFTLTNGNAVLGGAGEFNRGGGLHVRNGSPRIKGLRILGNRASVVGGGMYFTFSTSVVENVVVESNRGDGGGGAGFFYGNPSLANVILRGNVATNSDAGGALFYHCNATCRNVLVANNVTPTKGGGFHFDDSDVLMENMTMVGNTASLGGGLDVSFISAPKLINSVLWSNLPQQIAYDTSWVGMSLRVEYSNIQGGSNGVATAGLGPLTWLAGNLQANPQFDGSSDFRLLATSPSVNTGTNRAWMTGAMDLGGGARIADTTVDMGAWELQSTGVVDTTSAPFTPAGPASGLAGETLSYDTGGSTSTISGDIEYRLDFGDGTVSPWSTSTTVSHAWSTAGSFSVAAQARSAVSTSVASAWSAGLAVTITNPPPTIDDHYVSHSGANQYPYTNWAMAAHSIQDAIGAAVHGDTVWVTNGSYTGSVTFSGKNIRVTSMFLVTSNQADIDSTLIVGTGSGRVVRIANGETTNAALIGFTITNGWANGPAAGEFKRGGGVYVSYASPRLEHLRLRGNRADEVGGGLYLTFSQSRVRDIVSENNVADGGGGVACYYGLPSLERLTVRNNVATNADAGGLIFYHCNATLRNALVAGNTTTKKGGGFHFDDSDVVMENVTVADNSAGAGGGLNVSYSSAPRFVNSIAWGNSPQQIAYDTQWFGMSLTVEYSDVQGGSAGVATYGKGPLNWLSGNLNANPVFTGGGAYTLDSSSPCINAGDNRSWMTNAKDLAGAARIINGVVDMGAYESSSAEGTTITTPDTPAGSTTGLAGEVLAYTSGGSSCSVPGAGEYILEYRFDWGDGTFSGWSAVAGASHSWGTAGSYVVRAQARCGDGQLVNSPWSTGLVVVITTPPPVVDDHYVSHAGSNQHPYTNWAMAAHSIQDAIGAAVHGDTVWVTNGVYEGNVSFSGKNIRVVSMYTVSGDPADIASTVIKGTGNGNVVRAVNGETSNALIRGFTITNGYATGSYPFERGGGILCQYASPRIEDVRVTGNRAQGTGGGIHFEHSGSALRNAVVEFNQADGAAGIGCYYGAPSLMNVIVRNNVATNSDGGGLLLYHSSPVTRNVLVADNTSPKKGGGLHFDAASPLLENVTVVGNTAGTGGGLSVSYSSHPKLLNSILWDNEPQQVDFDVRWFAMALSVESSDLEGGLGAIDTHGLGPVNDLGSNLSSDPLFADADYRLGLASPCINAGANRGWMVAETDIDGQPRIQQDVVDMGAYEATTNGAVAGSLRCVILPDSVLALGARWRLQEGSHTNWNDSGATLFNLAGGTYTVEFKPVASWTTPSNISAIVVAGVGTDVSGTYEPVVQDIWPPVIVSVQPPEGFVTTTNFITMSIVVTDNVAVAVVTVNGHDATPVGSNTWEYTVNGVRGAYNDVKIVAYDTSGNFTPLIVNYARDHGIKLHAVYKGYWRIRNPFEVAYSYMWESVETTETGSGIINPHSDVYFTTSPEALHVNLYITGVIVDTKKASDALLPPGQADERQVDSDGDGLKNIDEAAAATDPFAEESTFVASFATPEVPPAPPGGTQLRSMTTSSSQPGFSLSWETSPDNFYSVEISTDLRDWAVVPAFDDVQGTGEAMGYTNDTPAVLYFRLSTRPAN